VLHIVASGSSQQGLGDQQLPRHGSSSSLTSSVCSVQSGCTEKAIDNLSMKDGSRESILEGRYILYIYDNVIDVHCSWSFDFGLC